MRILLVADTRIPVHLYGGTQRIIWWLGKTLAGMGHEIRYLVKKGSVCPFATVLEIDDKKPLAEQVPDDIDLIHLHFDSEEDFPKPFLFTYHANATKARAFHPNTVFISRDHARRHGGSIFVYNGLDFDDYGTPVLDSRRMYYHFLGNAAWRVKNVQGAIDITGQAGVRLHVLGGTRVNFRRGLRVTLNPHVRFHGMVGGDGKNVLLNGSNGLIFPALWHEPFGLAIIESLYFGCPVFGTPYGSLPELLGGRPEAGNYAGGQVEALYSEFGCLSNRISELVEAIRRSHAFDRFLCQEYVIDKFSALVMARNYLQLYEQVLNGRTLHDKAPVLAVAPDTRFLPLEK